MRRYGYVIQAVIMLVQEIDGALRATGRNSGQVLKNANERSRVAVLTLEKILRPASMWCVSSSWGPQKGPKASLSGIVAPRALAWSAFSLVGVTVYPDKTVNLKLPQSKMN